METEKIRACTDFLDKIRRRFGDYSDVYRSFMKIMSNYGQKVDDFDNDLSTPTKVYNRVLALFHGHADLVYEFEGFFCDNTEETRKEIEKAKGFAMEDSMHELDLMMCGVNAAVNRAEKALRFTEILDPIPDVMIYEALTELNLKYFEKLYGEFGGELIKELSENPRFVLPVILERLKKKKQELEKIRNCARNFWADLHRLRAGVKISPPPPETAKAQSPPPETAKEESPPETAKEESPPETAKQQRQPQETPTRRGR